MQYYKSVVAHICTPRCGIAEKYLNLISEYIGSVTVLISLLYYCSVMVIESLLGISYNISLTDFLFLSYKVKGSSLYKSFSYPCHDQHKTILEWGCFKFFMSFFFILLKLKMKGHSYIEHANN